MPYSKKFLGNSLLPSSGKGLFWQSVRYVWGNERSSFQVKRPICTRGGGVLTLTWYTYYVPAFKRCFFANFGILVYRSRIFSQTKASNLHKLGHNASKFPWKAPNQNWVLFCANLVYWWVVNGDKNRYSESQLFKVPAGTSTDIFFEEFPPACTVLLICQCCFLLHFP